MKGLPLLSSFSKPALTPNPFEIPNHSVIPDCSFSVISPASYTGSRNQDSFSMQFVKHQLQETGLVSIGFSSGLLL